MQPMEMYVIKKRSNGNEQIRLSVILPSAIRIVYITKSKSYSSLHH